MLTKLYKNQNGAVHYYECWNNGRKVVVHWGALGRVGESKTVTVRRGETAASVIASELSIPRSKGYKEIDIDDHKMLIIQHKTETWGDENDLDKRCAVESVVNESLGWTGNGHCDGGQIGSGSIEVFAYVIDPHIACRSLVIDLRGKGLLEGAVIAHAGEDEDYVVLHPKDFRGKFEML